jgi:shikimate dehydrogenase
MHGFSPGALTRTLALVGDPVAHSLSPRLHNAALRHLDIDAVYVALRCDASSVAPLMRALAAAGGAGSVTVPHKRAAAAALDHATEVVRRTGACNTFWAEQGMLCGDNTDIAGFRHAALRLLPSLHGISALIIGAGGAAAAALCALLDDGAAAVTLLSRSPGSALRLGERLDPDGRTVRVQELRPAPALAGIDLVINATTLGMHDDDPLPLDLTAFDVAAVALDIVYRQGGETAWVRHARSLGMPAADGTEMLLGQAAAAFETWFATPAPIDIMRKALVRP